MLDLGVINGSLYNGSGAAPENRDVGVKDGKVVAVVPRGGLPEALRTIDAAGCIVTPGFVDPHTHMDAQLWWAPNGAPSVLHGVTSVVIGSCGFGVAPLAPGTEEYVLRSLESVEEIPFEATRSGLPMSWGSWPDFFDQLGTLELGVNVAGFVPHSALRTAVLDKYRRKEPATHEERREMVRVLETALAAGAVGFSSSRGPNHNDGTGAPVPSRSAADDEFTDLVNACRGRVWQMNIKAKADASDAGIAAALEELATYRSWSERANARLTWTPLVAPPGDMKGWRALLDYSSRHQNSLLPQVSAQAISAAIRFDGASQAALIDGWAEAFLGYGSIDDGKRKARLADPVFRKALHDAPRDCKRGTSACFDRWRLMVSPSASEAIGLTMAEYARTVGLDPVDAMLDLALADDLATVIDAPMNNTDEEAVQAMATSEATLFGIGDAGAHVTSITNYTYPTCVLAEMARDKAWMSVATAVYRLSRQPAEALGLRDRGLVAEGSNADLCVIDLGSLAIRSAQLVSDLPGGARRLHRAATGYRSVIVNGTETVRDDQLTEGRAGRLIRV